MKVTVKDGTTGHALGFEEGGASENCTGVSDKEVVSLHWFDGGQKLIPGCRRVPQKS
jgi:hypothetical protein